MRRRSIRSLAAYCLAACAMAANGCTRQHDHRSREDPRPGTAASELVQVESVVDGDTFITADGRSVRLLGLDAPEVYRQELGTEYFSTEATEELKRLIEGAQVTLWPDQQDTDQYGRLLRYVFLTDGTFVNYYLVRHGFAQVLKIEPDTKFHRALLDAQLAAKQAGAGMWSGPVGQYTKEGVDDDD